MKIGEKIKHFRELRNFDQKHMAHMLDISQPHYCRIENGVSELSFSLLERITQVLEIRLQDLITFDTAQYFNVVNHSQIGYNVYTNNLSDELTLVKQQLHRIENELAHINGRDKK